MYVQKKKKKEFQESFSPVDSIRGSFKKFFRIINTKLTICN